MKYRSTASSPAGGTHRLCRRVSELHGRCKNTAVLLSALFVSVLFSASVFAHERELTDGNLHTIELVAEKFEGGYFAYRMRQHTISNMRGTEETDVTSRYPSHATIPGPTIVIDEGDEVDLRLIHEFNPDSTGEQQVSVHVHGVHYDILSDGTVEYLNLVKDESATPVMFYEYRWIAAPGTAGTWPYHDHNMTNHNGAEDKGLYGALIVNKKSGNVDISINGQKQSVPHSSIKKDYVLYMVDDMFVGTEIDSTTGKQVWLGVNPALNAQQDTHVRFHVIALGTNLHTFKLDNYSWIDPGTSTIISEKKMGPLEKHVFAVKANADSSYRDTSFSSSLLGMNGRFNTSP